MLNLVLDTNAWIYLANGYNPKNRKLEEETHFQTAEWLLKKIEEDKCRVFSNYIIKLEWERNKEKANELIDSYKNQIDLKKRQLKNKRKQPNICELTMQFRAWKASILSKIEKNDAHINMVEEILKNSIEIPVTDRHKVDAADLGIAKKPPFHHKDNSIADAIIFISTVGYFYYHEELYINDTIFVSNNTSDFGESVNSKKLHPELAKMLTNKPIEFRTNLAEALEMGEDIIAKYQSYLDYLNRDVIECLMDCKGTNYFMGEVEFTESVDIKIEEKGYTFNPKQLLMDFGEIFNRTADDLKAMEKRKYIRVDLGICDFCSTNHLRCECGEVRAYHSTEIECGCGRKFSFENDEIELINENLLKEGITIK